MSKPTFSSAAECFREEYVSYNRLVTYYACPQKFKLLYLDGHEPIESDWFTGRGHDFHSAVARGLEGMVGYTAEGLHHRDILPYLRPASAEDRQAAKFLCKTFPKAPEIVKVEYELHYRIGDVRFFGIIDCVLQHDDGSYELLDYKTGKTKVAKGALIRVYLAYLAAGQQLYEKYGQHADPWMTLVGYFTRALRADRSVSDWSISLFKGISQFTQLCSMFRSAHFALHK